MTLKSDLILAQMLNIRVTCFFCVNCRLSCMRRPLANLHIPNLHHSNFSARLRGSIGAVRVEKKVFKGHSVVQRHALAVTDTVAKLSQMWV